MMNNVEIVKSYLESGCDILTTGLFLNKDTIQLKYDGCEPYTIKPTAFRLVTATPCHLFKIMPSEKGQRVLQSENSIVFINDSEVMILIDTYVPPPFNREYILLYFNTSNDPEVTTSMKQYYNMVSQLNGFSPKGLFGNTDEYNTNLSSIQR